MKSDHSIPFAVILKDCSSLGLGLITRRESTCTIITFHINPPFKLCYAEGELLNVVLQKKTQN